MLNTYGLCSINRETFNLELHDRVLDKTSFSRRMRDIAVTGLRVHNAVFNVLGYIPGVSTISGCVRMATGLSVIVITVALARSNVTVVRGFALKAVATGIAQIVRGIFEALVPFGWIANAAFDCAATWINLSSGPSDEGLARAAESMVCNVCNGRNGLRTFVGNNGDHVTPHDDVAYPFPFSLLHYV